MSRTMWMKKLIGGTSNNAKSIKYDPAETGRAQTNVESELDKINSDLMELQYTVIATANANQTYRAQLQSLYSALSSLTPAQKARCAIITLGGYIFRCTIPSQAFAGFDHHTAESITARTFWLGPSASNNACWRSVTTTSGTTFSDDSTSNNTTAMELVLI